MRKNNIKEIEYYVVIFNYPNGTIDIKPIFEAEQAEEVEAELEQAGYRIKDIDWMTIKREKLKYLMHQCIIYI